MLSYAEVFYEGARSQLLPRLRYHHSKRKRRERKEKRRSRLQNQHKVHSNLLLLTKAKSKRAKTRNCFVNTVRRKQPFTNHTENWYEPDNSEKHTFPAFQWNLFQYLTGNLRVVPSNFFGLRKGWLAFNDESDLFILLLSQLTFVFCALSMQTYIITHLRYSS